MVVDSQGSCLRCVLDDFSVVRSNYGHQYHGCQHHRHKEGASIVKGHSHSIVDLGKFTFFEIRIFSKSMRNSSLQHYQSTNTQKTQEVTFIQQASH